GAHQRPFAPSRKAGATEAAQRGVADRLDNLITGARAGKAGPEQRIAALADVALEIPRRGIGSRVCALSDRRGDTFLAHPHHLHVADGADRRAVASPHAGRAHNANIGSEPDRQRTQEMLGSRHRAGERIADSHGHRRRRGLVFLHHVEMGVEGRNLVDLGERELHLLRERGEMGGREMAVAILNEVQMLDQEIAPARAIAQQRAHLRQRLRLDLTAFGRLARAVAPAQSSAIVGACVHLQSKPNQNSPTMRPSGPTSIESAAGTLGRPGMVMISPQIATTNSAPAERRTSRTVTIWPSGAPLRSGLVEKLYWVLAMQTGTLP